MKKLKQFLCFLLVGLTALTLIGCAEDNATENDTLQISAVKTNFGAFDSDFIMFLNTLSAAINTEELNAYSQTLKSLSSSIILVLDGYNSLDDAGKAGDTNVEIIKTKTKIDIKSTTEQNETCLQLVGNSLSVKCTSRTTTTIFEITKQEAGYIGQVISKNESATFDIFRFNFVGKKGKLTLDKNQTTYTEIFGADIQAESFPADGIDATYKNT